MSQTQRYVHQQHLQTLEILLSLTDLKRKKEKEKEESQTFTLYSSRWKIQIQLVINKNCEHCWFDCFTGHVLLPRQFFQLVLMPWQGLAISCCLLSSFSAKASLANQILPVSYLGQQLEHQLHC